MKVWTALDESIDHRVAASRRDPDADHEVEYDYSEVSDDAE